MHFTLLLQIWKVWMVHDVRYHLGTGILFERVIRQTDSSQQFGALGKIAAHGGVLGVHGIAGGHKSYHAAGTHLVQCFGEKVVVNTKVQLVVGFVIDLILTERYIADGKVKEVTPIGGLKACLLYTSGGCLRHNHNGRFRDYCWEWSWPILCCVGSNAHPSPEAGPC